MRAEDIRNLPIGTRIRGKLGEGTITVSNRYGKGVKLDNWNYLFEDDTHGFADRNDQVIEELVTEVIVSKDSVIEP